MDVRNLRQILAIREHGSFAKAAEVLGISQPTLSKSIARLEDELQVVLFRRTAAGSELTPIGEMVADRAARVVAETNDLIRDTSLHARGEGGRVRIGIGAALRSAFLPRLMVRIAEQHPHLQIDVEVTGVDRLLPWLTARDLDNAFCALRAEMMSGDYRFEVFLTGEIICCARPGHPLAGRSALALADIEAFPTCAMRAVNLGTPVLSASETAWTTTYTTNDYDAVVPMAAASETVVFAPAFTAQRHLVDGALVRLDLNGMSPIPFVAATTRSASYSPILRRITGYAMEIGAQMDAEWREISAR